MPESKQVQMCCCCEKLKLCEWVACPYLEDVYHEIEMGWWCDECYQNSADDI